MHLIRAYADLRQQAYMAAGQLLAPVLHVEMSVAQRLRVLRVLSVCAHAEGRFEASVNYISEAMDLATRTNDLMAYYDLGSIGAIAAHDWQRFDLAADYYGIALDALQSTRAEVPSANLDETFAISSECSLFTSIGIEAFLLADYEQAQQCLRHAHRLLRILPSASPQQNKLEGRMRWMNAYVARWKGDWSLAQQEAIAALALYESGGRAIEIGRLHVAIADLYLDVVAPLGGPHITRVVADGERNAALDRTGPHLLRALAITHAEGDSAGEGLAMLSHARYLCASGAHQEAIARILEVEDLAFQLRDYPLLAQALTLHGDAHVGLSELGQATTCYELALDALGSSNAPAYQKWPMRAILTLQEWSVDSKE
jgi:tetratricopeptide (TPR) repeat protein